MLRQERLVGRDHVLSALEHLEHDRTVGLQAADKLHHRLDLRIIHHRRQVRGQKTGPRHDIARAVNVRIDNPHQLHVSANLAGNSVLVLKQEPRHTGTDRSEADNGNFRGRVCHRLYNP